MVLIKIFLLVLLVNLTPVIAADVWKVTGLTLSAEEQGLVVNVNNVDLPFSQSPLKQLSYQCQSSRQIYHLHQCEQGRLRFNYEGEDYHLLLNGWFDFSSNQWDLEVFNEDRSLVLYVDSKDQEKVRFDINKFSLESLSVWLKSYAKIPVPVMSGFISTQVVIDFATDLRFSADYQLSEFSWESEDGAHIIAESDIAGQLNVTQLPSQIIIEGDGFIDKGEGLFTDIYTSFEQHPVNITSKMLIDDLHGISDWQLSLSATEDVNFDVNIIDWQNNTFEIDYHVDDLALLYQAYFESYFEIIGINDAEVSGRSEGRVVIREGSLHALSSKCHDINLSISSKKTDIDSLNCDFNWQVEGPWQNIYLNWQKLLLAGMPIDQSELSLSTVGQQVSLEKNSILPVFDGSLVINELEIADLFAPDISIEFKGEVMPISLALVTEKMGWPLMNGSISGNIPGMRKVGQSITFDGSLDLTVFDGYMRIDHLSMERLFGVAPVIAADISFERLDLGQITSTFDFGDISGLIKGYVNGLRITNWKPDRLNAHIESMKAKGVKQVISQRAIDNISSIGGVQGALSRSFLRFFKYFKYKRIGIGCKLRNEICQMSGIVNESNTYPIVQGKGIPSINIIGVRRYIDWQIFIDRLLNAGY